MPYRWVISPVVNIGGVNRPYVATLRDPGKEITVDGDGVTHTPRYTHSTVYSADVTGWCLSFVRGVDLSAIDSDAQVIDLFDGRDTEDAEKFLDRRVNVGRTRGQINRLKNLLKNHGVNQAKLNEDDPLWMWLKELGGQLRVDFPGPRGTWTK